MKEAEPMAALNHARAFALSLPEVTEQDHHGFPSIRICDKIFATVPGTFHLHIRLDEPEVRMAVGTFPQTFEELWWGKRLAGVRVALASADFGIVTELLAVAWRRKAPRHLLTDPPKRRAPARNPGS